MHHTNNEKGSLLGLKVVVRENSDGFMYRVKLSHVMLKF